VKSSMIGRRRGKLTPDRVKGSCVWDESRSPAVLRPRPDHEVPVIGHHAIGQ
jgi:hypothetical protein